MCGAKKLMHFRFTRAWPERMIGDTAYDSDPLDRQLWREHRIRMIAPNRLNLTQDRRELRRYCRRWKIERLSLGCITSVGS